ncbi:TPA: molecular chaperone [Escherichia coli]|nr:molecular chaperone [Escherichia coli]
MLAPSLLYASINGITLSPTRVIHQSPDNISFLKVTNYSESDYWLIRSWVSNYFDDHKNEHFIITPPIHRLESLDEIQLQIRLVDDKKLPKDRESLFRLNVLSIPPEAKKNLQTNKESSSAQFALKNKIKLIYRPSAIGMPDSINEKLRVSKEGHSIYIKNPSPFFVTLTDIFIDGVKVNRDVDEVLKPFSEIIMASKKPKEITFSTINDFGGKTPPMKFTL